MNLRLSICVVIVLSIVGLVGCRNSGSSFTDALSPNSDHFHCAAADLDANLSVDEYVDQFFDFAKDAAQNVPDAAPMPVDDEQRWRQYYREQLGSLIPNTPAGNMARYADEACDAFGRAFKTGEDREIPTMEILAPGYAGCLGSPEYRQSVGQQITPLIPAESVERGSDPEAVKADLEMRLLGDDIAMATLPMVPVARAAATYLCPHLDMHLDTEDKIRTDHEKIQAEAEAQGVCGYLSIESNRSSEINGQVRKFASSIDCADAKELIVDTYETALYGQGEPATQNGWMCTFQAHTGDETFACVKRSTTSANEQITFRRYS